ncbi:MAG: S41 family peptidase [Planctomycetes bacterium]|nr:S41 family peptidase [Planctomycetota bacterium]
MPTHHDRQAFAAGMLLGVSLTGLGVVLAQTVFGPVLARSLSSPEEQILADVHDRLIDEYVVPLDQNALMRKGVRAMISSLEDDYSSFVGPEEVDTYREESSGRLIGIGAQIQGDSRIRYPQPGGPAERAGLRPGDTILAIDGQSIDGLDVDAVVARIKGPAETRVHLQIRRQRDDEIFEVEILREPVPTGTIGRIEMLDPEQGLGRIHIRSFARTTTNELDVALDRLTEQGLRGLVLDLRYNRGGLLDAAVDCAARFVHGGVICTLEGRGNAQQIRKADPNDYRDLQIPIIALLNEHSASGSEVLAAALRDRGAALIAGTRSYGKGVYQQVQRYKDGEFVIKFTAGYYVTPSGRIIEGHMTPDQAGGIEPDLPVAPVPFEQSRLIFAALYQDEIPEKYRSEVISIFEFLKDWPSQPEDPVTDHALRALTETLSQPPL